MDCRIAVDLGRGCLEHPALEPFGKPQHVDRAVDARLRRLNGIVLVVDGGCRTGEIVDLINLDVERECHVVTHEFEAGMADQVPDVLLRTGEEIVDAEHIVTERKEAVTQVRAKETGAAGDQNTSTIRHQSLLSRPQDKR